MDVTVVSAGGTLDKTYGSGRGIRDLHIGSPVVKRVVVRKMLGRVATFDYVEACQKDSLDMNNDDRAAVVRACKDARAKNILITHDTDTMIETAQALAQEVFPFYRIVLTGALLPACVIGSDAEFNIGLALGFLLSGASQGGIFIAMNGIHRWNECSKDEQSGFFLPTD